MIIRHTNHATEYCGAYCPDAFIVALSYVCAVALPRTLWGDSFGECTTCRENGDPAWTCPATLSAYADIGGSGADIVELDGSPGEQK